LCRRQSPLCPNARRPFHLGHCLFVENEPLMPKTPIFAMRTAYWDATDPEIIF
jgi:hypothetical protein